VHILIIMDYDFVLQVFGDLLKLGLGEAIQRRDAGLKG
jgi:hypothetical protein